MRISQSGGERIALRAVLDSAAGVPAASSWLPRVAGWRARQAASRSGPEGVVISHDPRSSAIPKCLVCGAQFCYHGLNAVISHQPFDSANSYASQLRRRARAHEHAYGPVLGYSHFRCACGDTISEQAWRERGKAFGPTLAQSRHVRIAWFVAAICGAAGLWFLLLAALAK